METVSKIIGVSVGIIAFVAVVAILFALPTMWLWNWLMPVIFNLPTITIYQALGLNILSGILLKSNISNSSK